MKRPNDVAVPAAAAIIAVAIVAAFGAGCAPRQAVSLDGLPAGVEGLLPGAERVVSLTADPGMTISAVRGRDGVVGYVAEREVSARSGPFSIRIVTDAECRILAASVTEYPGARGGDVASPRFVKQFEGKGPDDALRLGEDVDAVTGATLSSRAMTDGVREMVVKARDASRRTSGAEPAVR